MESTNDQHEGRPGWQLFTWFSIWILLVYLAIVLPFEQMFPVVNRWFVAAGFLLGSAVLTHMLLRRLVFTGPAADERTKDFGLLAAVLLFCLICADIGFIAYTNIDPSLRFDEEKTWSGRRYDKNVWDGESMPDVYYPSEANFWLYKPEQHKTSWAFGQNYYVDLLELPLLRESVLERQQIEFNIDRYGLRNVDEPAGARIFILGDSFVFGYHTTQDAIFSEVLKTRIGEPVYNMGISAASPYQQLLMFRHFQENYPDDFRPERLIWMIYEGNDLEEDYSPQRPPRHVDDATSLRKVFAGTLVGRSASAASFTR